MAPIAKQARAVGASENPAFQLQAKSKSTPNPGLIQQSPAKFSQGKSLDFL
jgi:hypothetical protein